jgi:hypothetical protein
MEAQDFMDKPDLDSGKCCLMNLQQAAVTIWRSSFCTQDTFLAWRLEQE